MNNAKNTKDVISAIIDSYKTRVGTVSALMRQTIQVLKNFQRQQEEMAEELKNILANNEFLRKKDFDGMMEGAWKKREKREKEVHDTLEIFLREEKGMIDELRGFLSSGKLLKLADFVVLKERILNRQREREKKVSEALKSFHLEQEELNTALRRLLSKGEQVKIKHVKNMLKGLHVHRIYKESSIGKAMEKLEMVDREVDTIWQKVMMRPMKNRI